MTRDGANASPQVGGTAVAGSSSRRLDSGVALTTSIVGLVALVTGFTTPPRSGPFCRADCLGYPYTDAAAFVPRDYWWLYPQSLLVVLVLVLLVRIHAVAAPRAQVFSGIAVALGTVAVAVLLVDYVIQLAVLQPSLLRGETSGLSVISQYNPHGVFIAVEDLGYLLLGFALLMVAGVFTRPARPERGLRWLFLIGGAVTVAGLPALAVAYGADLEYRYEVAAIAVTWITVIVGGLLLFRWFGSTVTPPPGAALPAREKAEPLPPR
jgi:hypothetical protein